MRNTRGIVRVAGLLAAIAVSLFALGAAVASGPFFRYTTMEDGLVENLTACYLLAAGVALFMAGLRTTKVLRRPRLGLLLLAGAILMVAACMEEISWGQRLLGFQTPTWFRAWNAQAETNLHNVPHALTRSGWPPWLEFYRVLYAVFFLFGVVAAGAAIVLAQGLRERFARFEVLVPFYDELLIFALAMPFLGKLRPHLMSVNRLYLLLSALVIVVLIVLNRRKVISLGRSFPGHAAAVLFLMSMVLCVFQVLPLKNVRSNAEVRELLMAIGCFAYAGGVLTRAAEANSSRFTAGATSRSPGFCRSGAQSPFRHERDTRNRRS
jgi:hypothetical protein